MRTIAVAPAGESKLTSAEPFLHPTNVPDWVQRASANRASTEKNLSRKDGDVRHYSYSAHGNHYSSKQILSLLEEKGAEVLDIEAGSGGFIRSINQDKANSIRAIGVSIADFRSRAERKESDEGYLVGDAQSLLAIEGIRENQFDAVFSHLTFSSFANPARVLMECYRALKPGAPMLIYHCNLFGLNEYHRYLVMYLQSVGYNVSATYTRELVNDVNEEKFATLIIIKTEPTLNLPIQYHAPMANRVSYTPSPVLLDYRREKTEDIGEEMTMLNIDEQLFRLLKTPGYALGNGENQAAAIKNIVKQMSPKQRDACIRELKILSLNSDHSSLWKDYVFASAAHNSRTKLINFTNWHPTPAIALVQLKALALAELSADEESECLNRFLDDHLEVTTNKDAASIDPKKIQPPALCSGARPSTTAAVFSSLSHAAPPEATPRLPTTGTGIIYVVPAPTPRAPASIAPAASTFAPAGTRHHPRVPRDDQPPACCRIS